MTRQFGSIWFWFSALALAILAVFLLYPLLNVLTGSIGSSGRNGWVTLAGDPKYVTAIVNTFVLGIAAGVSLTLSLFEMLLHAVRHAHAKKQR